MSKSDQIWPEIGIFARPCRLIRCPVGGLVGGCGARAVSRTTPIYFMILTHTPPGTDCSQDYWTTTYYLPSEQLLKKDNLLTTIPTLAKGWKVSFELKPSNYNYKSYASVIHMTIGGSSGNIGDRTPALWLHRTKGVYLATALNGSSSVGRFFKGKNPPVNEWTFLGGDKPGHGWVPICILCGHKG